MRHGIAIFLFTISHVLFAQNKNEDQLPILKKKTDGTYERVYSKTEKFIPPSDGILIEETNEPIVEKEWHEPIKEEDIIWDKKPWEVAAEAEDTILAKHNKKSNPFLSDEEIYIPVDTPINWEEAERGSVLILEETRRLQLDSNIKIMLINGATDKDIFAYVAAFKRKYGLHKNKPSKENIQSVKQSLIIWCKRFALPIITIISLVFICYKFLNNITLTKVKAVLKSEKANKLYKIIVITAFVSSIVLCYTNPTLREFKEIAPSKLDIEKGYGFCDDEGWRLSHTKVKNNILYSYYTFSFGCMEYDRTFQKVKLTTHRDVYYIGIFNNFYRIEYP
jgi:hypothetical protein